MKGFYERKTLIEKFKFSVFLIQGVQVESACRRLEEHLLLSDLRLHIQPVSAHYNNDVGILLTLRLVTHRLISPFTFGYTEQSKLHDFKALFDMYFL